MIKIDSYEYYYNPEDGKYYIRKRKNSTNSLKKLKDKLNKSKDKKDRKDKTSKGNKGNRSEDAANKGNKSRDKADATNKTNKSRDRAHTANETNKSQDRANTVNEVNQFHGRADTVNETNKLDGKMSKVDITDHSLYRMSIKNNHNHPIKVSIVMPTYNKYHQTSLSLYGLSKQTFSHAEYEVILVDDASSDNTSDILKEVDVPFKFKYIQMKQNKGRSSVRNIGINHAEGDLLIFLDGEMLAPPSFIENHYKHHMHESNLVVTGAMHYEGVFTFIMPDYNEDQVAHLKELVGRDPEYRYFVHLTVR